MAPLMFARVIDGNLQKIGPGMPVNPIPSAN